MSPPAAEAQRMFWVLAGFAEVCERRPGWSDARTTWPRSYRERVCAHPRAGSSSSLTHGHGAEEALGEGCPAQGAPTGAACPDNAPQCDSSSPDPGSLPLPCQTCRTETWETALAQLCGLGDSRAGLPTANTAPGWIMTLGMIAAGYSWSRGQSWAPHGSVLPSETPRAAWPQRSRAPQLMARVMELSTVSWGPALPLCLRKRGGRSGVAGARPSISHSVHGSPAGTGQPGRAEHG